MMERGRAKKKRARDAGLRTDIQEAIEQAWPDDIVEMCDPEESYFWEVRLELAAAFRRLRHVTVHEREAESEPAWFDGSDEDDDLPAEQENPRSYHLFFVAPEGDDFTFTSEMESIGEPIFNEEGEEEGYDEPDFPGGIVPGKGTTGWAVAVSLVAPFAVITLSGRTFYDDGFISEPSMDPGFTDTGERFDAEAEFKKHKGDKAFGKLLKLRGRIHDILAKYKVEVLPEGEWRKPVPWLRADPEVHVSFSGEPVRVLDAFFFEGI